ncbi:MAG: hypothetical protein KDA60_10475 [Planctomycetales bacterium]|nr:hypothetical protein [Planctomycetales bacterium]
MNTSRPYRRSRRRPASADNLGFNVERLETREMLSGVVKISVHGSVLQATGDDAANDFRIESVGGVLTVTGNVGTVIDFSDGTFYENRDQVTSFRVATGSGNDSFEITGISPLAPVGYLRLFVGDGDNYVEVDNCRFTNVNINSGNGPDFITVASTQIGDKHGNLVIQNGDGNSTYGIYSGLGINRSIHGNVTIKAGTGTHRVTMSGVRVRDGVVTLQSKGTIDASLVNCDKIRSLRVTDHGDSAVGSDHGVLLENAKIAGAVAIGFGDGSANVNVVDSTTIDKTLNLRAGETSLEFNVSNSIIAGAARVKSQRSLKADIRQSTLSKSYAVTTSGNGVNEIVVGVSTIEGTFAVNTRDALVSRLKFDNVTVAGNCTVRNADGASITLIDISRLGGKLSVVNGDGSDYLVLSNTRLEGALQINHGTGESFTALNFFGQPLRSLRFQSKEGEATFGLSDVLLLGVGFIRTGGGNDLVHIEAGGTYPSAFAKSFWVMTEGGNDTVKIGGSLPSQVAIFEGRVIVDGGADTDTLEVGISAVFNQPPPIIRNFETIA